MIPVPTPTLLPIDSVSLPISLPTDLSLWDYAPWAIQVWNTSNRDGVLTVYQVGLLMLIILVGISLSVQMLNRVNQNDE